MRGNVLPPLIWAGRQSLYLLPDMVLVVDGARVGGVGYARLSVDVGTTRFVEDGAVPSDARQVGTTWRYVNKGGGPDRRFRDNRQLPVMEYGEVTLRSGTGLAERLQVSRPAAARAVHDALVAMA